MFHSNMVPSPSDISRSRFDLPQDRIVETAFVWTLKTHSVMLMSFMFTAPKTCVVYFHSTNVHLTSTCIVAKGFIHCRHHNTSSLKFSHGDKHMDFQTGCCDKDTPVLAIKNRDETRSRRFSRVDALDPASNLRTHNPSSM